MRGKIDPADLRRQTVVRAVKAPVVLMPAFAGAAALGLGFILGQPAGLLSLLGAAGLLFGLGAAFTRLFLGGDKLRASVHEDLRKKDRAKHDRYLRRLARRLSRDKDNRTGECVDKLRKLHRRLCDDDLYRDDSGPDVFADIRDEVEQLYGSCLESLERSLEFWRTAKDMSTDEARQELLDRREELLLEVLSSIGHLEATADQLQAKQLQRESDENQLAEIRQELDMGLRVARQVEQRMGELENGLASDTEKTGR